MILFQPAPSRPAIAQEISLVEQAKEINPNAVISIDEGCPITPKIKLTAETHLRGQHGLSSLFQIDPTFQGKFVKVKNSQGRTLAYINASCHFVTEEAAKFNPKMAKSLDKSHALGFETDVREEENSWAAKLWQRKFQALITGDADLIKSSETLSVGTDIRLLEHIRISKPQVITYGLETDDEVELSMVLIEYLHKAVENFHAESGQKKEVKSNLQIQKEYLKEIADYSHYLRTGQKLPSNYFFDHGDFYVTFARNRNMAKRIDQLLKAVDINLSEKLKQDPKAKPAILHFFSVGFIHMQDFEKKGMFLGIPSLLERMGWTLKPVIPKTP